MEMEVPMLTEKAFQALYKKTNRSEEETRLLMPHMVENAVILAAGMSTRFAPLSYEKPKGLLRVRGEILIERQIRQLQEAGIRDITVVVGYQKEQFAYLEDKLHVQLVVNEDYARYNNTSSLMRVLDRLGNTYICSSDNYFTKNVFEPYVYRAYYSAVYSDQPMDEYFLTTDADDRITQVTIGGQNGWYMLGPVYFDRTFSAQFRAILQKEYAQPMTRNQLWENLYMRHIDQLHLYMRAYPADIIYEFDSLAELRDFDSTYCDHVDCEAFHHIQRILQCMTADIDVLGVLKQGMTNDSFLFSAKGEKYIFRRNGMGTDHLIDRENEKKVYAFLQGKGITEKVVALDPEDGYKISVYYGGARVCNSKEMEDVRYCMDRLRSFHEKKFYDASIRAIDPFRMIVFYETLRQPVSIYADYNRVREEVMALQPYLRAWLDHPDTLCHFDAVSDNFLFVPGREKPILIDWEYAGLCDPLVDVAMFAIYAGYDAEKIDRLISMYFGREPELLERARIYAYVAIGGLLWSNWCEYKMTFGITFGAYAEQQYRYAAEYASRAAELFAEDKGGDGR